jgi:hypothetical protein
LFMSAVNVVAIESQNFIKQMKEEKQAKAWGLLTLRSSGISFCERWQGITFFFCRKTISCYNTMTAGSNNIFRKLLTTMHRRSRIFFHNEKVCFYCTEVWISQKFSATSKWIDSVLWNSPEGIIHCSWVLRMNQFKDRRIVTVWKFNRPFSSTSYVYVILVKCSGIGYSWQPVHFSVYSFIRVFT